MTRPIVVIPSCTRIIEGHAYDSVHRKYSSAVAEISGCQPLLAPLGSATTDVGALLDVADAILLSGSLSNVHPSHYGEDQPLDADALDPERDNLTLPLIREAVARRLPLFAICRGFQELNVALGGTLEQAVHTVSGRNDHRERPDIPLDDRFGPAHPIALSGELRDWLGADEIIVNSLHGQGIQRLAEPLVAEAHATDGLIEAVRAPGGNPFCLGVQWHPEWQAKNNPVSVELFRRFGAAASTHASGQPAS